MKLEDNRIVIDRQLSELDEFVLGFLRVLEKENVDYVLVSGYVAILTGRSRGTEDVDLVIEELSEERVNELVKELKDNGFWVLNTEEVYSMLKDDLSVRFAEEGKAIPNFEVAFPQDDYDQKALDSRLKVKLESGKLWISPLELQIAYKLYLGSEKDFEDALHLHQLFRDELDEDQLQNLSEQLNVRGELDELRET